MSEGLVNLLGYLNGLDYEYDDGAFTFSLPNNFDKDRIVKLLKSSGYQVDEHKTVSRGELYIKVAGFLWESGDCPLFPSWERFFDVCAVKSSIPKDYLICDKGGYPSNLIKSIEAFMKLRLLLSKVSDHCWPESGDSAGIDKILIIQNSESDIHRYEFCPRSTLTEISKIKDPDISLESVNKLLEAISLGDIRDSERSSLIRSAFHDLANSSLRESEVFTSVLNSLPSFYEKYRLHYDVYVQRFSVNKSLAEINKKRLDFTHSINDIVSSNQTKALTIPGALIVVGAVMKVNDFWDGLAVLIGIFLSMAIVFRSVKVYENTFKYLKEQINDEFGMYDFLSEGGEVREKSISVRGELLQLVNDAESNLSFVKYVVATTVVVAFIYIVIDLFRSL